MTRDQVYEIGTTRPTGPEGLPPAEHRIVAEMQPNGEIPNDAVNPLAPVYDRVTGRAIGFQVAPEIVSLG